jgi:2,3-bisphosphoglycerate-independent phosphoglycerate mutase
MFKLPFFKTRQVEIKPIVLLVLDGFGLAPDSEGNAISIAKTPNYDSYIKNYPHGELIASGESVGLPANEVGNTEVGHLTMGAGKVIFQDLKRNNVAIEKRTFYDNKALLLAANHVKKNNSKFHLVGLVGSGHVHSSVDHLYALLQFCKKEEVKGVFLHLFTDGRDSPPKEGIKIVKEIESHLEAHKIGKIASISGRYYAMDRDRRWDRTEKAYKAMVLGHAIQTMSAQGAIRSAYVRGQTDEFIEPTIIADANGLIATIDDNDAIIFFNFRVDRPKQLAMAFVLPNFETLSSFDFGYDLEASKRIGKVTVGDTFDREKILRNIFFVTFTEYQKGLPVSAVAFGPETVEKPFSLVLSERGLKQLHMAESEKERFVKYYFDGLREEPVPGEDDLIVPSPKVATYDKKPEMSLPKLISEFKKQLNRDFYHFFIMNIANPDMVAHSGNIKATIKAMKYVDHYLGKLVEAVLAVDGTVLVTGDHGNAEEMLTFPTSSYFFTSSKGVVNTDHSNNPVPLIIVNRAYEGNPIILKRGALSDIAPTILSLMGIPIPEQMEGVNLLSQMQLDQSRNVNQKLHNT